MLGPVEIDQNKKKFYQNDVHFKKFEDLTDERITELQKEVERYKGVIAKEKSGADKYNHILAAMIYSKGFTFDEKVYILINVMDPELTIYHMYRNSNIMPVSLIKEEDNDFVKRNLAEERNKQLDAYRAKVRDQIGFFENKLVTYEQAYFKKYKVEGLVFGNKLDESKKLFDSFKEVESLIISDDRYQTVLDLAIKYQTENPDVNFKDFVYHVLHQAKLLGIHNNRERIIFCINILDKDLRAFQIFEEENKWDVIEKRCKEEIGIKNRNFLYAECNYVKTYLPEESKKYTF